MRGRHDLIYMNENTAQWAHDPRPSTFPFCSLVENRRVYINSRSRHEFARGNSKLKRTVT